MFSKVPSEEECSNYSGKINHDDVYDIWGFSLKDIQAWKHLLLGD